MLNSDLVPEYNGITEVGGIAWGIYDDAALLEVQSYLLFAIQ